MKKLTAMFLGLLLIAFGITSPVFADENQVAELKNEVQELKGVVSALQSEIKTMKGHITPTPGKESTAAMIVPPGEEHPSGTIKALSDIHMGGYVDVQYSMALNDGTDHRTAAGAQNTGTNTGRIFDTDQDSFTLNLVELNFQRIANPEGGAGFRADIMIGEDAEVVDFDASTDRDEFSIQQAYVEYNQPLSAFEGNEILPDTINLKAGRFVTLAGAEVIEAADNWNISRSFAFGLAIPFTHLGVRSNFKMFNDKLDVYAGINNGWDTVVDNNKAKTLEFGAGYTLFDKINMFHSLYWGAENNDQTSKKRHLFSHVASYNVTDKLSIKGELNHGYQPRVLDASGTENNGADWQSYAGYVRYQFTDKFATTYRAELFRQDELFRSTLDYTLSSHTLTAEYKLTDSMLTRFEYRADKSNDAIAFDGDSSQQTLGAQVVYII
ncbi:MAG: porin [Candidatus Omnitrophica bacterium]|nr:porin [Candidatus Omnitrophota bacterium]